MTETNGDVIATIDDWRVVIVRDDDSTPGDGDIYAPVLRVDTTRFHRQRLNVSQETAAAQPYYQAFMEIMERHWDIEVFERYLRIFHGTHKFQTYGPNQGTDYTYIGFDTTAWAESVGIYEPDHIEDTDLLEEWRQYVEGDVWGYIVQRETPGACGHEGCPDHTEWTEVASSWGYYGREYAEESAIRELIGHRFDTPAARRAYLALYAAGYGYKFHDGEGGTVVYPLDGGDPDHYDVRMGGDFTATGVNMSLWSDFFNAVDWTSDEQFATDFKATFDRLWKDYNDDD